MKERVTEELGMTVRIAKLVNNGAEEVVARFWL